MAKFSEAVVSIEKRKILADKLWVAEVAYCGEFAYGLDVDGEIVRVTFIEAEKGGHAAEVWCCGMMYSVQLFTDLGGTIMSEVRDDKGREDYGSRGLLAGRAAALALESIP